MMADYHNLFHNLNYYFVLDDGLGRVRLKTHADIHHLHSVMKHRVSMSVLG